MKTHLFCFSSTGNGLMIARSLARRLGETEIFSIPRLAGQAPDLSAPRLGLIFPMYYGGVPRIVERFIGGLPPVRAGYVFAVTSGRDENSPLGVPLRIRKLLKRRGVELAGGFYVRMVSNFTPMFDALPADEQRLRFAGAEARIGEIAGIIESGRRRIERNSRLKSWLISRVLNPAFKARIPKADRNFWTDGRCTGCGICARVCPVGNIEIRDGKPAWLHHCELCLGCLHWCPQGSVQYGKKTAGRKRYRNPVAQLDDFLYR